MIQEKVYRQDKRRIDTSRLYIRNALANAEEKPPRNELDWNEGLWDEIDELRLLVEQFKPCLVLCFGAFAFEFGRRVNRETSQRPCSWWGAKRLGTEFRVRLQEFNIEQTNFIPLLHVSIARGKFLQSHEYFCAQAGENYFEVVGQSLAQVILSHRSQLPIWL